MIARSTLWIHDDQSPFRLNVILLFNNSMYAYMYTCIKYNIITKWFNMYYRILKYVKLYPVNGVSKNTSHTLLRITTMKNGIHQT